MSPVRTACTYDCPDACALLVETEGDRITICGDPDHPVTRGFVCHRVRRHPARLRDPDRLRTPLLRTAGGWQPLDWEQALDRAAAELERALADPGPAGVLYLSGGGAMGLRKELVGHFFNALGPVTTLRGGVCDQCGKAAQVADFGDRGAHDYTDLEHSGAVVLWGKNPMVTAPHLVPFVRQARRRGAPVVLVEVMPTEAGALADRVVRVAPSGDGLLALAVVRRLIDEGALDPDAAKRCENFGAFEAMLSGPGMRSEDLARRAGCKPDDVHVLAELYTGRRPVATWVGWGLQRRQAGGFSVRCIDALGLLSGNIGVRGGGVNYGPSRSRGLDRSFLAPATGRTVSTACFGTELPRLDRPPVRFAYLHGANPACQFADARRVQQALQRVPFVVVADAFMTDTAEAADLVLPVTLMLEEEGDVVGSFGHHHVARVRRAVAPPAGVREDVWIAAALNRRLGRPPDPLLEDPAAAVERMARAWFEDSRQSHRRNPCQPEVPFADVFPTPSGKARLVCEMPAPLQSDPVYPLRLLTSKPRRYEHSQIPEREQHGSPVCTVHPGAPGAAALNDGGRARLVSPTGVIEVVVRLDSSMPKDVCQVFQGGWLRHRRGVNPLVEGRETDLGGGTAFYDQAVRIEPCAP